MQTDNSEEPCFLCPDYTHPNEEGSLCVNDNCMIEPRKVVAKSNGRCIECPTYFKPGDVNQYSFTDVLDPTVRQPIKCVADECSNDPQSYTTASGECARCPDHTHGWGHINPSEKLTVSNCQEGDTICETYQIKIECRAEQCNYELEYLKVDGFCARCGDWTHPSEDGKSCTSDLEFLGDNQSLDITGHAIDCLPEEKPTFNFRLCELREQPIIITRESPQWDKNKYDNFIEPMIDIDGRQYQMTLLYRGSRDGFTAEAFHALCDNQGPTLTVATSNQYNQVFGGFTYVPWRSTEQGEYVEDDDAFVFSVTHEKIYTLEMKWLRVKNDVFHGD